MKEKIERTTISKPIEIAKILYEQHKDSFTTMSNEEFESWITEQMNKSYIQTAGGKIQIKEGYKKVIWRYVAFIHYWNTPKQK